MMAIKEPHHLITTGKELAGKVTAFNSSYFYVHYHENFYHTIEEVLDRVYTACDALNSHQIQNTT